MDATMPEEPELNSANEDQDRPEAEELPQCRICLDGEDPELGRLIRPCLCKGSVSYVHVKCLHRWRNTSTSNSAFYRCPQCGYHYRFARTQVLGIAENPIVVGVLSGVAFTLLLFFSSFITTYLISGTGGQDSGFFIVYPWETFREVIRTVVCVLTDTSCNDFTYSTKTKKLRYPTPKGPPTLLGRFFRRLLLGLPTVGAGSLFSMLWSLPFPITHWLRVRLRRSSRGASDFATLLMLTVVLIGAARALYKVYQLTERTVKRVLLRAEDAILEVA